jgi:hypothetical protein
MKEQHLLELPTRNAASAQRFEPNAGAWLRVVMQHWCAYGPDYPKKPTTIFTNLPRTLCGGGGGGAHPGLLLPGLGAGAIDPMPATACVHRGQRHNVVIATTGKAPHQRVVRGSEAATWPPGFCFAALQACALTATAEKHGWI